MVAEPTIKYRPPLSNSPHWMTAPGSWVPVETPDPEPDPAGRALAALTSGQKAEILERLLKERNDPA